MQGALVAGTLLRTYRQATDDNITRRMSFACWLTKATDDLFGPSIIQREGDCGKLMNIFWDHVVTTRCKHECQSWRERQRSYKVTMKWRVNTLKDKHGVFMEEMSTGHRIDIFNETF